MAAMERRAWGRRAFAEGYFRWRLADPRSVVLVLRTPAGELGGFLTAGPDPEEPAALYVEDTLVDEPHRGRGLVGLLGAALEREARRRGYRFLTRDAAVANGYADAIERAYAGRVLERRDHPSEYGPQRYLRIALGRATRRASSRAPVRRPAHGGAGGRASEPGSALARGRPG